jgi:hypothetical protein
VGVAVGLAIVTGCLEGGNMAQPDNAVALGEAFIVAEQERMGIATQTLRGEVTDPLLTAPGAEIELRAGIDQEDHRVRERLVLTLPAGPVNSLEGSFVLWVGASGAARAAVRGAKPTRSGEGVAVQLEARCDVEMEGRWAYSRQPGIREVSLASFDDPERPIEAEVFHAADLQEAAMAPSSEPLDGGWSRLRFDLTAPLLEKSKLLDACERVLEDLDRRAGGDYLRWPAGAVSEATLDAAGADIEERFLAPSRQFNLTLEVGAREITRGKRLQPLARYPITLVRDDGSPVAATLGCSISGS